MKPFLSVTTGDEVKSKDKIDTYKNWFNGLKHFFTVKILPPRR